MLIETLPLLTRSISSPSTRISGTNPDSLLTLEERTGTDSGGIGSRMTGLSLGNSLLMEPSSSTNLYLIIGDSQSIFGVIYSNVKL